MFFFFFLAAPLLRVTSDLGPGGCPSETMVSCSGHGSCLDGFCVCGRGYSGISCTRLDYLYACPQNCSAPLGGRCEHDRCVCAADRSGDDCADHTPVNCTPGCSGNGECTDGACACQPGFHGRYCEDGCPGYVLASGEFCSGHGLCKTNGPSRCKCFVGFAGVGCELDLAGTTSCPRACSSHGKCLDGRCTCRTGYAGRDCSIQLRRGTYAHALDSFHVRLGAVLTCFVLSGLGARLAYHYIDRETPRIKWTALKRVAEMRDQ